MSLLGTLSQTDTLGSNLSDTNRSEHFMPGYELLEFEEFSPSTFFDPRVSEKITDLLIEANIVFVVDHKLYIFKSYDFLLQDITKLNVSISDIYIDEVQKLVAAVVEGDADPKKRIKSQLISLDRDKLTLAEADATRFLKTLKTDERPNMLNIFTYNLHSDKPIDFDLEIKYFLRALINKGAILEDIDALNLEKIYEIIKISKDFIASILKFSKYKEMPQISVYVDNELYQIALTKINPLLELFNENERSVVLDDIIKFIKTRNIFFDISIEKNFKKIAIEGKRNFDPKP